jgi:hypothetical protein
MDVIFRYGWLFLIVLTSINGFLLKVRSKKYIAQNSDLADGYDKLFKGWLLFGNIPWVIMAIGDMTKITNGIWEYCNPKSMNPMVLLFHFSAIVNWIIGSKWIYLNNGAVFLARHPGLIRFEGPGISSDITSPKAIKILWTLGLMGGIIGMIMSWIMDF